MIPYYGLLGVALSFLLSNLIFFLVESYISYKIYPVKFEYIKLLLFFLLFNLLFFIVFLFSEDFLIKLYLMIFLCFVLTIVFILFLINNNEKKILINFKRAINQ